MSPITILFVLIIALCIAVTVVINILTAKHSNLKDLQKKLEAELRKQLDSNSGEAEKARQDYDAALVVYNAYIARFPGVIAARILGFKAIQNTREEH